MIEAMKQARNAFVWNLNTDLDNIPACEQWAKMLRKNIDALDKAIAEAEKQDGDCQRCGGKGCVACDAREQEPVAWMDKYRNIYSLEEKAAGCEDAVIPLYTHPPQRTWVGLTDEDLEPLCNEWRIVFGSWTYEFAKAIEAKLKQKNGYVEENT